MREGRVKNPIVRLDYIVLIIIVMNLIAMFHYGNMTNNILTGNLDHSLGFLKHIRLIVQLSSIMLLLGLIIKYGIKIEGLKALKWYIVFFISALLSWLVNMAPIKSLYFTSSLILGILIGLVHYSSLVTNKNLAYRSFYNSFIVIFSMYIFSALFTLVFDYYGAFQFGRLQATFVTIGSNGLSWLSFLYILFIQAKGFEQTLRNKIAHMLMTIASIYIIIATQTRTTWFVIGALYMARLFVIKGKYKHLEIALFAIFLGVIVYSGSIDSIVNIMTRGGQQLETLSGRLDVWLAAYDSFIQSPVLGYGLWNGMQISMQSISDYDNSVNTQAHGSIIELLVSVGIIGFGFWALFIAKINLNLLKLFKKRGCMNSVDRRMVILLSTVMIAEDMKLLISSEFVFFDYSTVLIIMIATTTHYIKKQYMQNNN